MANSLNGFIKLHRKLVAWGWYQDYVVKDVFLHLLLTATFRENPWRDRVLKQGQVVTSYKHLSENLGFSIQQIRTAISKLKSTGEITTESTHKYTVITIVNWDDYQCQTEEEATQTLTNTTTKATTNCQHTNNTQITHNQQQRKNDKNIRNKKEINKEKNSVASPEPPLGAVGLAEGEIDLHKFKPDGTPLPKGVIDAGLTWAEYLEIKNQ